MAAAKDILSWVHFGDLHITGEQEQNYRDFQALIDMANVHLAGGVAFAVLPGDNADDGTPEQFRLVRDAVARLKLPLHVLPGDHDRKPGHLDAFYDTLRVPALPQALTIAGYRCLFLDIVSSGTGGPDFRLGRRQHAWLERELDEATQAGLRSVVFMHAYPADLREDATAVHDLFVRHRVSAVDMGHTHYNEVANDGHTIYLSTRSTGQIEEGPVGFSIAAVDRGIVSWRFKPLGSPWPCVLITAPADHRFVTDRDQVVQGRFQVRALAWSAAGIEQASYRIDGGAWSAMTPGGDRLWQGEAPAPTGDFDLTVRVTDRAGQEDEDAIRVAAGAFVAPQRTGDGSDADTIGAWPGKHLFGSQLGPNRNGRKW